MKQVTLEELMDVLHDERLYLFSDIQSDIYHISLKDAAQALLDKYNITPKLKSF